jgi:single-strand DNA-binding protein
VRVVGRLKQDRWTGNDGKPHSKVSIVAEHVEFRPECKKNTEAEKVAASAAAEPGHGYPEDAVLEETESVRENAGALAQVAF